jgi:hypothetical protein
MALCQISDSESIEEVYVLALGWGGNAGKFLKLRANLLNTLTFFGG